VTIAGSIVHRFGYQAGFWFFAAVAAAALAILFSLHARNVGLRIGH
jgi:hypothetical protein